MTSRLDRLGRAAAGHPWRAIAAWILIAVAAVIAGKAAGGEYNDNYKIPGVQSQTAINRLQADFPSAAGSTNNEIVFHAPTGSLTSAQNQSAIATSLAAVRKLPHVVGVIPPAPGSTISRDGTTGFATVAFDVAAVDLKNSEFDQLTAAMAPARAAGLEVEYGGDLVSLAQAPGVGNSDKIGLVAALIVLLIAFGSAVAAGLPLVTAIVGLAVGLSLVGLLAAFVNIPSVTPILGTMIGLGVGIDYALFIISRHRENLAAGLDIVPSIGRTSATAGQSVLFAGTTVVIAICGLALAGVPFVASLGFATAVVVAVAVAAALTLMPALLGLVGPHINSWELPWTKRDQAEARAGDAGPTFWARWADRVCSRPWPYLVVSLALLLALAAPLLSMRLGETDAGTLPKSSTQRKAYDLLAQAFGPGFNGPLTLVVELPAAGDQTVMSSLVPAVSGDPDVATVSPPTLSPSGKTAVVNAIPKSSPQDAATNALVQRLRNSVLPKATSRTGATALVTGSTAVFIDLSDRIASRLALFIAVVIALSFILLMIVFRSVLVPLKAAVMNVLSICAAYGVIVAVFQWGWAKGLVGLQQTVPIVSFVPMMMFAILFGLSMDYEVFLLSRIREDWVATGDSHQSVVDGLAHTARVITSAAVIMVSVFASFLLVDDPTVKMFGLGLAVAVLVDATLIRMVLVPATMTLLGAANWWLPHLLDRVLPHLDFEGGATPAAAAASGDGDGDGHRPPLHAASAWGRLTDDELEVAHLIGDKLSDEEIGQRLGVSRPHAEAAVADLCRKLGETRAAVAAEARRRARR
ncbi:MAG TPA: MMPL family transporter [Acidimicrobiales bacterium]|nr:MMPL family transporter [Acidimicrobiales bacterium]